MLALPTGVLQEEFDELQAYIATGVMNNPWLNIVLSNDLAGVAEGSTASQWQRLPPILKFLGDHAPASCWGSSKLRDIWKSHEGFVGFNKRYTEDPPIFRIAEAR